MFGPDSHLSSALRKPPSQPGSRPVGQPSGFPVPNGRQSAEAPMASVLPVVPMSQRAGAPHYLVVPASPTGHLGGHTSGMLMQTAPPHPPAYHHPTLLTYSKPMPLRKSPTNLTGTSTFSGGDSGSSLATASPVLLLPTTAPSGVMTPRQLLPTQMSIAAGSCPTAYPAESNSLRFASGPVSASPLAAQPSKRSHSYAEDLGSGSQSPDIAAEGPWPKRTRSLPAESGGAMCESLLRMELTKSPLQSPKQSTSNKATTSLHRVISGTSRMEQDSYLASGMQDDGPSTVTVPSARHTTPFDGRSRNIAVAVSTSTAVGMASTSRSMMTGYNWSKEQHLSRPRSSTSVVNSLPVSQSPLSAMLRMPVLACKSQAGVITSGKAQYFVAVGGEHQSSSQVMASSPAAGVHVSPQSASMTRKASMNERSTRELYMDRTPRALRVSFSHGAAQTSSVACSSPCTQTRSSCTNRKAFPSAAEAALSGFSSCQTAVPISAMGTLTSIPIVSQSLSTQLSRNPVRPPSVTSEESVDSGKNRDDDVDSMCSTRVQRYTEHPSSVSSNLVICSDDVVSSDIHQDTLSVGDHVVIGVDSSSSSSGSSSISSRSASPIMSPTSCPSPCEHSAQTAAFLYRACPAAVSLSEGRIVYGPSSGIAKRTSVVSPAASTTSSSSEVFLPRNSVKFCKSMSVSLRRMPFHTVNGIRKPCVGVRKGRPLSLVGMKDEVSSDSDSCVSSPSLFPPPTPELQFSSGRTSLISSEQCPMSSTPNSVPLSPRIASGVVKERNLPFVGVLSTSTVEEHHPDTMPVPTRSPLQLLSNVHNQHSHCCIQNSSSDSSCIIDPVSLMPSSSDSSSALPVVTLGSIASDPGQLTDKQTVAATTADVAAAVATSTLQGGNSSQSTGQLEMLLRQQSKDGERSLHFNKTALNVSENSGISSAVNEAVQKTLQVEESEVLSTQIPGQKGSSASLQQQLSSFVPSGSSSLLHSPAGTHNGKDVPNPQQLEKPTATIAEPVGKVVCQAVSKESLEPVDAMSQTNQEHYATSLLAGTDHTGQKSSLSNIESDFQVSEQSVPRSGQSLHSLVQITGHDQLSEPVPQSSASLVADTSSHSKLKRVLEDWRQQLESHCSEMSSCMEQMMKSQQAEKEAGLRLQSALDDAPQSADSMLADFVSTLQATQKQFCQTLEVQVKQCDWHQALSEQLVACSRHSFAGDKHSHPKETHSEDDKATVESEDVDKLSEGPCEPNELVESSGCSSVEVAMSDGDKLEGEEKVTVNRTDTSTPVQEADNLLKQILTSSTTKQHGTTSSTLMDIDLQSKLTNRHPIISSIQPAATKLQIPADKIDSALAHISSQSLFGSSSLPWRTIPAFQSADLGRCFGLEEVVGVLAPQPDEGHSSCSASTVDEHSQCVACKSSFSTLWYGCNLQGAFLCNICYNATRSVQQRKRRHRTVMENL